MTTPSENLLPSESNDSISSDANLDVCGDYWFELMGLIKIDDLGEFDRWMDNQLEGLVEEFGSERTKLLSTRG